MASRNCGAWRLAATIAAHHWLLTAGMSTRSNSSNGTSACSSAYGWRSSNTRRRRSANHCFWNADAAIVASSCLSAMPGLLQPRGSGHHRVEPCVIRRGWRLIRVAAKTDVRNADAPSARRAAPDSPNRTPRRPAAATRRRHRPRRACSRSSGAASPRVCAHRPSRLDTCRRARQPGRRRCARRLPRAPLPHGPTSATTTAPCDSMAWCSVWPSTGAPVSSTRGPASGGRAAILLAASLAIST